MVESKWPVTFFGLGRRSVNQLLEKYFRLKQNLQPGSSCIMKMVMENEYLSPWGYTTKRQSINALLERHLEKNISSWSIGTRYQWKDVNFTSEDQTGHNGSIKWTFAHGMEFKYFKTISVPKGEKPFTESDSGTDECAGEDIEIGNWFSSCPATPAINLMLMMNWDVLTFEEFSTRIANMAIDGTLREGTEELVALGGTYVQLGLKGCEQGRSYFKNGRFLVKPIGFCQIDGVPVCQYEYRSQGVLNVHKESAKRGITQSGNSFFFGKILLNCETSDIIHGDLVELITASIEKDNGKIIPVQKRRFVHLSRV